MAKVQITLDDKLLERVKTSGQVGWVSGEFAKIS